MIHSNNEGKLKGFERCVSTWLDRWQRGELKLQANEKWQEICESEEALGHVVYISLSADSSQALRSWKAKLQAELGQRITIAQAILALTELLLQRVD